MRQFYLFILNIAIPTCQKTCSFVRASFDYATGNEKPRLATGLFRYGTLSRL
jgi:hypothetical protein